MEDFIPYMANLLNGIITALIYVGGVDFIYNYLGNRAWTLLMDWYNKAEFNRDEDKYWNGGKGLARTTNGLTFLQVYDVGHTIPSDQPEVALDMIKVLVMGGSF